MKFGEDNIFRSVCDSVYRGPCKMSLPVWLPGSVFLLGVFVPASIFLPVGLCPGGFPFKGVSVQGVSVQGSLSRRVSVWGSLSRWVFFWEDLCPGGSLSRSLCRETYLYGGQVDRMHPTGMLSCFVSFLTKTISKFTSLTLNHVCDNCLFPILVLILARLDELD